MARSRIFETRSAAAALREGSPLSAGVESDSTKTDFAVLISDLFLGYRGLKRSDVMTFEVDDC